MKYILIVSEYIKELGMDQIVCVTKYILEVRLFI